MICYDQIIPCSISNFSSPISLATTDDLRERAELLHQVALFADNEGTGWETLSR